MLLTLGLGQTAQAHPHVFVDAKIGFVFTPKGELRALRIWWSYDEFTSLVLFETLGLDQDNDGAFNDQDRARVVQGETDWDPEYKGDTYLEVAGQDFPLGRPQDGEAWYRDGRVGVAFELPLPRPAPVGQSPVIFRQYDPVYYYAYKILPQAYGPDLPAGCQAAVAPFRADGATQKLQEQLAALSREDTPEQENVGRLFTDEIYLTCG